jgi:hypothetical protein
METQKSNFVPLPPPEGKMRKIHTEWGDVQAIAHKVRNMDNTHTEYAYITKPNTDFGITASIRKIV